jgi:pilus assembly protein Flp/PilA
MRAFGRRLVRNNKGVAAVEYALIAALIALAIIAGVRLLGDAIKSKLVTAATAIENNDENAE